jgi:hypothetical protein
MRKYDVNESGDLDRDQLTKMMTDYNNKARARTRTRTRTRTLMMNAPVPAHACAAFVRALRLLLTAPAHIGGGIVRLQVPPNEHEIDFVFKMADARKTGSISDVNEIKSPVGLWKGLRTQRAATA